MNYMESIKYLEEEVGFASVPGLSRIRALLKRLGNPEKKLRCIHVAGTNGKGSAVAMLSSVLRESGCKTASYTSPHLHRYNERFVINGQEISDEQFAEEISLMRKHCEAMAANGEEVPTLFEIVTAAAFHYFAEENVDIAVMEVGLGGTYDATNVIEAPLLSLIMSISMDHMDYLGNTLSDIAREKCGIIKKNCPVVLYSQEKIVYNMAKEMAQALSAPFYCETENQISVHKQDFDGTIFSVKNHLIDYQELILPLSGDYQIVNCITVLNACAILQQLGLPLTEETIRRGILHAFWHGRMEVLKHHPLVLLDGAHNADGIAKLAQSLPHYVNGKKITLVLGVLGDKEYPLMLSEIFPLIHQAVLTEPLSERKLDLESLAKATAHFHKPVILEKEIPRAFDRALEITDKDDMILCCGSLYMIGEIREYILSL